MIDTKEWREMIANWYKPGEIEVTAPTLLELINDYDCLRAEIDRLRDEIDRLTAELDRYRWHPYPKNKPTENGEYLVTMSDGCHGDDFRVIAFYVAEEDFWTDTGVEDGHYEVIAFRAMPEAYKPEVSHDHS